MDITELLAFSAKQGASDLHLSAGLPPMIRVDGDVRRINLPALGHKEVHSLVYDIMNDKQRKDFEEFLETDFSFEVPGVARFRVNAFNHNRGAGAVFRTIPSKVLTMDQLGMGQVFKDLAKIPRGIVLVTGPTGSGKTVSLYTGLNILNVEGTNISTAEDPVEINLEGINQVNVNARVGLDFAAALRSFLRQDPDVVMVGEIRDLDTASIAIKAAQTGHLVLSTLHTNSAAETLTRLANMGVPSFNIATSVSLIIAQRLARRLCSSCKAPAEIPKELLLEAGFTEEQLQTAEIYKPVGCEQCKGGYKGRVGIYEVVRITDAISRIIMEGGNSIEISDAARKEGFNDLRTSALQKVAQGVTSLEEANRVTTD